MKKPPGKRALIIAPHNDDEVLSTGGIIQQYLERDCEVKVGIITNGDGQRRRLPLTPRADFIKLGNRRQRESLESLELLGLSSEDIIFFGYPDRGISKLWNPYWQYDNLYRSKFTRTDHSPYLNSYTEKAPYCGRALVSDIQDVILEYRPEVIYFPHPNDGHTDHWATNAFVIYSLEELVSKKEEGINPILLTYLVHRGRWPVPRGKRFDSALNPPPQLNRLDTEWKKIYLKGDEIESKYRAIRRHRSQTQMMRKYLVSFARANELFGEVPTLNIKGELEYEDSDDSISAKMVGDEKRKDAFLTYLDPKQRSILASLRRYTDIKSVNLARSRDRLKIRVNFFNLLRPANHINIHIKPICKLSKGNLNPLYTFTRKRDRLFLNARKINNNNSVTYQVAPYAFNLDLPLEMIDEPPKLLLGVELTRRNVIFAKSAYRLIKLGNR